MAYLALARKWRPKAFSEVVGQQHVVQALSNALDSGRVHHAFLFTGTRGVGKTTLARIFAKSLNCEEGTSAEPCQVCATCQSIDEGRFVDLIEVDAASRTKVDETRELLENVQYAPTSGKYKVYLIDEVHMFSNHSFNALLKTLEEPPEHVKFLLATTDPQKLPVTVLSRCLQFNLRAMRPEQVENQLIKIVGKEGVDYDASALQAIARAADGSMRDGLSLLDQAIAQGAGEVRTDNVQGMLGTIKTEHTQQIITALLSNNVDLALKVVADMADNAVDFTMAIDDVLMQLYHLSLAQVSPSSINSADIDVNFIKDLSSQVDPETLQLFYQIGLISKRDIPLAPSLRVGFEMALLRMFAFEPADNEASSVTVPQSISALSEPQPEKANVAEKKTVESSKPNVNVTETANSTPPASAEEKKSLTDSTEVAKPAHADALQQKTVQEKPVQENSAPESTAQVSPAPKLNTDATVERAHNTLEGQAALVQSNKQEHQEPSRASQPLSEPKNEAVVAATADTSPQPASNETHLESRQETPPTAGQDNNGELQRHEAANWEAFDPSNVEPDYGDIDLANSHTKLQSAQTTHEANLKHRSEAIVKPSSDPHRNVADSASDKRDQPNAQVTSQPSLIAITLAGNNEWGELVEQTALSGMSKELAMNCAAERINDQRIDLSLSPKLKHLFSPERYQDIQSAVQITVGSAINVSLDFDDSDRETPADCLSRLGYEHEEQVIEQMHQDTGLQSIVKEFGATIKENSIKPLS